jgi:uncharacterized surface protein with fasciclin (FAS1) repeats
MKRVIQAAVLLAASLVLPLTATAHDYTHGYHGKYGQYPQSIAGIVSASGGEFDRNPYDFDILLNAVIAADLAAALDDSTADLTVFAPNDKAFIRTARDLGYHGYSEEGAFSYIVAALTELGGGDPIPVLTNILLYHVSAGSKYAKQVSKSGGIDTLLGGATILPARSTLLDNDPDLKDARIIWRASNIKASNGIIHTISRVMIPVDILPPDPSTLPTITDIVAKSGGVFDHNRYDYDILLRAVLAAGLDDELATLQDITVLAPNDKAFIKTARDLGYHGYDEEGAFSFIVAALTELGDGDPIPLLTNILLYHVVPAAQTNKQILESDEVTTLLKELGGDQDALISPNARKRTLGDNEPELRDPFIYVFKNDNIRASNGFIQTISRVLIPYDL